MVRKRQGTVKKVLDSRDKLLREPTGFVDFAEKNFLYILIGVAVLIVIIAGSIILNYLDKKRETTAAGELAQSVILYQQALGEGAGIDPALEKFETISRQYRKTGSGVQSLFYAGNCYYTLGNYDEAIARYESFLRAVPEETHLKITAYDSLGYCFEEKGDYKKAIEYFRKTIEPAPGLGEMGYLNLARCYEALDDVANSLQFYQRVILENPQTLRATYVQEKINRLTNRIGTEMHSAVLGTTEEVSEKTDEE